MADIRTEESEEKKVRSLTPDPDANTVTSGSTDVEGLFSLLSATRKQYDTEKIRMAYDYACRSHEGQFRASGEPYISHPVAVAEIVAGLELDTDSICAALLHDTVEDCPDKVTLEDIRKKFGDDVSLLVDGLTKLVNIPTVESKEEAHIENLRKMLLAMSKDVRVIFIKLCDRLHNMRTLDAKPEDKRRITAHETMQVYAPLAHRLGMQKIKQELENLCLKYLDPYGYEEISGYIEHKYGENLGFIEHIRRQVSEKLAENDITFTLEGRIKSVYSIYNKMYTQNKNFNEIYDFYALRVIVNTESECYAVLGYIHEMFRSVPGRFKDYISTPKPNLYRSLHTTVIGNDGIPFEVQIRTWEMHHIAQYGVAAHWKYKSGERSKEEMDKKLEWIARLLETEDNARDPDEFLNALKTDIFHDEVFVFTPKGDVRALPQGATVIDFAYAIHSGVGNRMIGAKINGVIVPIDRCPQNGEIVEIITSNSSKGPSRDWLGIVRTSEARTKIRAWFKKEKRPENILAGKVTVDAELRKLGRSYTDSQRTAVVEAVSNRLGFASADDFYNTIGFGGLASTKFGGKLRDELDRLTKVETPDTAETPEEMPAQNDGKKTVRSNDGVILGGEPGCMVKFAHCCSPLPGDPIIGFVTKGFGVSIHRSDCPNVLDAMREKDKQERLVEAQWDPRTLVNPNTRFETALRIGVYDSVGLLADISTVFKDKKVAILSVQTQKGQGDRSFIFLRISCRNVREYETIASALRTLRGVIEVTRSFS